MKINRMVLLSGVIALALMWASGYLIGSAKCDHEWVGSAEHTAAVLADEVAGLRVELSEHTAKMTDNWEALANLATVIVKQLVGSRADTPNHYKTLQQFLDNADILGDPVGIPPVREPEMEGDDV